MKAGSKASNVDPAQVIRDHQVGLWRYLRAIGCDWNEAADLTQETFLTILQKPFEHYNDAATAAYLRRVAYNLFITWKRRSAKVVNVAEIEQVDTQWSQWAGNDDGEELLAKLRECLETLGSKARQALDLRFRDKVSRQDIGEALGMTEHGAKNVMQRAKKKLRECIQRKLKQSGHARIPE